MSNTHVCKALVTYLYTSMNLQTAQKAKAMKKKKKNTEPVYKVFVS